MCDTDIPKKMYFSSLECGLVSQIRHVAGNLYQVATESARSCLRALAECGAVDVEWGALPTWHASKVGEDPYLIEYFEGGVAVGVLSL